MILRPLHMILLLLLALLIGPAGSVNAQDNLWHGQQRILHYRPAGQDFILHEGNKKFNRALYGTHTAFRVETGDLPEFALYMPGMGGNCKIGIISGRESKWLTAADQIRTRYRPGSMQYEITDRLLEKGSLRITVLAMADREGMVLKIDTRLLPAGTRLVIAYGGASGRKFSRDGDIGADPPSSFELQPAYCRDNIFRIRDHRFDLHYGFSEPLSEQQRYVIQTGKEQPDSSKARPPRHQQGILPPGSRLQLADARQQASPAVLLGSKAAPATTILAAATPAAGTGTYYFMVENSNANRRYETAAAVFRQAEARRQATAAQIELETPDPYINPLAGALAVAADAIWEAPSYLHGAVAWRMRLPAWRGAYAADALGWQDRARQHFDSYLRSQVTGIPPGRVEPDTVRHFARQKESMGNAMFSNGYICRSPDGKIQPHHYDMNLVFFDQLLTHLQYTGDTAYIRKIWPALTLHLQWEKRNFDPDDDGLYDAYACIWASDALQYSGGAVTHATAYNYRANLLAARLGALIGADGSSYAGEARKILTAMNHRLWSSQAGVFGEYRDRTGLQRLHTAPGLWTIYHAIDAGTASPLQALQMLDYIDRQIPHIPVRARDLDLDSLYLVSTTNWQPYTWSINNVALAENLQTALAYWQGGAADRAFHLWKSALVETMYLSSSPGGFQQLSFYDAARGELYRDFADPIGVAARTLTEGLFGIQPQALSGQLLLRPGFPAHWAFARLKTPRISFGFKQQENRHQYTIDQHYDRLLDLHLSVPALRTGLSSVRVNNQPAVYQWDSTAVGGPVLDIRASAATHYDIQIDWTGDSIRRLPARISGQQGQWQEIATGPAKVRTVRDLHQTIQIDTTTAGQLKFFPTKPGNHTLLVTLQQGPAHWQQLITINVSPRIGMAVTADSSDQGFDLQLINHSKTVQRGRLLVNRFEKPVELQPGAAERISLEREMLEQGHNRVITEWQDGYRTDTLLAYWGGEDPAHYESLDIRPVLNARVAATFQQRYLEPRPAVTTLQLPWQGIGNWCYPLVQPAISNAGIRGKDNIFLNRIPFRLGQTLDIAYTSQWDNFPDSIRIPLGGRATHAYLLMAGTTNHQQSQMMNGIVYIEYTDGSRDSLPLINPENWWPLEQDYQDDGYAFQAGPRPWRLLLHTGHFTRNFTQYTSIKGFTDRAIAGGAATVLDLPLRGDRNLKSLTLRTLSNEVLIGLMSVSLKRSPSIAGNKNEK
ncbi:hypothetical protein GCM10027051_09840 [Niabella terrae]